MEKMGKNNNYDYFNSDKIESFETILNDIENDTIFILKNRSNELKLFKTIDYLYFPICDCYIENYEFSTVNNVTLVPLLLYKKNDGTIDTYNYSYIDDKYTLIKEYLKKAMEIINEEFAKKDTYIKKQYYPQIFDLNNNLKKENLDLLFNALFSINYNMILNRYHNENMTIRKAYKTYLNDLKTNISYACINDEYNMQFSDIKKEVMKKILKYIKQDNLDDKYFVLGLTPYDKNTKYSLLSKKRKYKIGIDEYSGTEPYIFKLQYFNDDREQYEIFWDEDLISDKNSLLYIYENILTGILIPILIKSIDKETDIISKPMIMNFRDYTVYI